MKTFIPLLAALTICSTALTAERQHVPLIPEVARDEVICFALYTVHNGVMKMTAQLYPLQAGESRTVALDLKKKGRWQQVAQSEVIEQGMVALFRMEN